MPCNIYQSVRSVKLSKKYIEDTVSKVLEYLKKTNSEVSVHLVGDEKMKRINTYYRGIAETTDVVAFVMQEGKIFDKYDLGDIFICVPQINRQAKKQSIPSKEEFTRVLIHGVLHLNGYDHVSKKDEAFMFKIQEKLLKKIYGV